MIKIIYLNGFVTYTMLLEIRPIKLYIFNHFLLNRKPLLFFLGNVVFSSGLYLII